MKRRAFVKGAGLAAAAGTATLAAPAIAQQRFEWNMVMPWPKGSPGVGVNAERFVSRVNEMSGGRLVIKLFAAGELVPPFESFDAVQSGTADLLHGTPYYWAGKSKAFSFFTTVPFGLSAVELPAWLTYGGGQELWEEACGDFGVQPFFAGSSCVQAGGWFKSEINTWEDLQGLKIRMAGLGGEVMRRAGSVVVLLPPGEIPPAPSTRRSGSAPGTTSLSACRRWPGTTTCRPSTSRDLPSRSRSTRRSSRPCPPICRPSCATPQRPRRRTPPPTSPITTSRPSARCSPTRT